MQNLKIYHNYLTQIILTKKENGVAPKMPEMRSYNKLPWKQPIPSDPVVQSQGLSNLCQHLRKLGSTTTSERM